MYPKSFGLAIVAFMLVTPWCAPRQLLVFQSNDSTATLQVFKAGILEPTQEFALPKDNYIALIQNGSPRQFEYWITTGGVSVDCYTCTLAGVTLTSSGTLTAIYSS